MKGRGRLSAKKALNGKGVQSLWGVHGLHGGHCGQGPRAARKALKNIWEPARPGYFRLSVITTLSMMGRSMVFLSANSILSHWVPSGAQVFHVLSGFWT